MSAKVFTDPNAWLGGYDDAAFFFTPTTDAMAVLRCLWSFRALAGPYSTNRLEPSEQAVTTVEHDDGHSYGVLTLPDGARVACASFVFHYEDDLQIELSLSVGSLLLAWPEVGAYPFVSHDEAAVWEPRLETTLAALAAHVHAQVPFRRGLVGFEGMGFTDELRKPGPVPVARGVGIFDVIDEQLTWHPPTMRGGMTADG